MTKLAEYTLAMYNKMYEQSELNKRGERLFEGNIVSLYNTLGASTSYYSRIRRALVDTGSIVYVQRGNRRQASIVKLEHAPPVAALEDLTRAPSYAKLNEVEREVRALRIWRESLKEVNIAEVLRNFEGRIARVEALCHEIERKQ